MRTTMIAPIVTAILWVFLVGAADRGCVDQTESDRAQLAALGTSAQNPETGECQLFLRHADMPPGWAHCDQPDLMRMCLQVITFAVNPDTGECKQFNTPCDVPPRWSPCRDEPTLPEPPTSRRAR